MPRKEITQDIQKIRLTFPKKEKENEKQVQEKALYFT